MNGAIQVVRSEDARPTAPMLLSVLPEEDREVTIAVLQRVELHRGAVIQDPGSPIEYGYFVESGVISVQATARQGRTVGVGMIGPEGFWGLSLLTSFRTPLQAIVQVPGVALKIRGEELLRMMHQSPALEQVFLQYACFRAAEAGQLAACNAMHEVEARLARWLLMMQDRAECQELPVTHDGMSQMLGTNRATISLSAEALKCAGLITYRRGRVQISDRTGLQSVACECYAVLGNLLANYRTELLERNNAIRFFLPSASRIA
jgi:CRP-like cAMP-binding protein